MKKNTPQGLKEMVDLDLEISLSHDELIYKKILSKFPNGCKKILLVKPIPFNVEYFELNQARNKRYYTWPPYGIGVLCSALKTRGYDVELIDFNFEILKMIDKLPSLDNDKIAQRKIDRFWKKRLEKTITKFRPDVVGLTCMFTMGHEQLVRTAEFVRKNHKKLPVVVGGVHITNAPEFALRESKSIDFACMYESDVSFCNFVDIVNKKSKKTQLNQVATIINKEYISISQRSPPNDDELNIVPDYNDLDIGQYGLLGEIGSYRPWLPKMPKAATVLTNRGCRARCSFCSVRNFNGKSVRSRSVGSVVNEIIGLKKNYGVSHITWIDDDLFFKQSRAIKLFDEISKKNLDITWCASNGVIASAVANSPDLIESAAKSGCVGLTFGLESGNNDILKSVYKPSRVEHYYKVGELMKNYPQIFTRGFLIIGFPNETLSQIKDTITMAQDIGLDWYGVQLLSPLPSTEIFDVMVDLGLIDDIRIKKNSEDDGSKLFVVRQAQKQRKAELMQKTKAEKFVNLFNSSDLSIVPTREELHDLWLFVDYWINYEPILKMTDKARLEKKRIILKDICNRMTQNNPLANYFLGLVELKLGNKKEHQKRKELANSYGNNSAYWRERLISLGLEEIVD